MSKFRAMQICIHIHKQHNIADTSKNRSRQLAYIS